MKKLGLSFICLIMFKNACGMETKAPEVSPANDFLKQGQVSYYQKDLVDTTFFFSLALKHAALAKNSKIIAITNALLGRAYVNLGSTIEDFENAKEYLEAAIKQEDCLKAKIDALFYQAQLFETQGKPTNAISLYQTIENQAQGPSSTLAKTFNKLGEYLFNQKKPNLSKAESYFLKAANQTDVKEQARAHYFLGTVYKQKSNPTTAKNYFELAAQQTENEEIQQWAIEELGEASE